MSHLTLIGQGSGVGRLLVAVGWVCLVSACGAGASQSPVRSPEKADAMMRDGAELVERGRAAMRRGDSIRAEHYFSLAIEQGYDEGKILPELLAGCLSNSRLRSALNYAEPYLRKHPKDSKLRYLVATVHLGLGQPWSAKQELVTLLRHEPDYADAHFLLGMLEIEQNQGTAEAHLSRFLTLRPEGEKANEARERLERARFDAKTTKTDGTAVAIEPTSVRPQPVETGESWASVEQPTRLTEARP